MTADDSTIAWQNFFHTYVEPSLSVVALNDGRSIGVPVASLAMLVLCAGLGALALRPRYLPACAWAEPRLGNLEGCRKCDASVRHDLKRDSLRHIPGGVRGQGRSLGPATGGNGRECGDVIDEDFDSDVDAIVENRDLDDIGRALSAAQIDLLRARTVAMNAASGYNTPTTVRMLLVLIV